MLMLGPPSSPSAPVEGGSQTRSCQSILALKVMLKFKVKQAWCVFQLGSCDNGPSKETNLGEELALGFALWTQLEYNFQYREGKFSVRNGIGIWGNKVSQA